MNGAKPADDLRKRRQREGPVGIPTRLSGLTVDDKRHQ